MVKDPTDYQRGAQAQEDVWLRAVMDVLYDCRDEPLPRTAAEERLRIQNELMDLCLLRVGVARVQAENAKRAREENERIVRREVEEFSRGDRGSFILDMSKVPPGIYAKSPHEVTVEMPFTQEEYLKFAPCRRCLLPHDPKGECRGSLRVLD